jgi:hypothetical protein
MKDEGSVLSAPESDRSGRRPFYFKRYRVAPVLFVIFVLTSGAAFLLYPSRAPVSRPAPITLSITTYGGNQIQAFVNVSQTPGPGANMFTISVIVIGNGAKPGRFGLPGVGMTADLLHLPRSTKISSCYPDHACLVDSLPTEKFVTEATDVHQTGANWNSIADFSLTLPHFAWSTNGLNVQAMLPAVAITRDLPPSASAAARSADPGTAAPGNTSVTVSYELPRGDSYDWTGGPAPYSFTAQSGHAGVTWLEPLSALSVPALATGTSESEVNLDNLRTFLAGALVGIGGGALVGAIQELTHQRDQRAERDQADSGHSSPGG